MAVDAPSSDQLLRSMPLPQKFKTPRKRPMVDALKRADIVSPPPIGQQIRDLRKRAGLTIPELAATIGRSVGYISQIERNISAVSISSLQEISEALGVQIASFFQAQAPVLVSERDFVVRSGSRRKLAFVGSGIATESLSPNLIGQIELILITIEPGGSAGENIRVRRGEEAGYVIDGSVELCVDGIRVVLQQGDAFTFTRTGPHHCVNPTDKNAIVLWVALSQ